MDRRLNNSSYGYYSWTFFRMHLYNNVTFNHMNDEDYSVFAHEYMHFLQNITTTYGSFMVYVTSEYMRSVAEKIRDTENGVIDIPYIPEIDSSNVYANTHILECTYNDKDEIKTIKEIVEIRNCTEQIESTDMDSIPYVEIDIIDDRDYPKTICFGACAIMESLAFLMEEYIAPVKKSAPDFPYHSAELVAQSIYPGFAEDRLNIIALCDVSLLTSSPGHTFVSFLIQLKKDNWLPLGPSDIYGKVLDGGYNVSGSVSGSQTFEDEMNRNCLMAIDSLCTFFNSSMPRFRQWIEETFKRGFALRFGKRDFMLDIVRNGNIKKNPVLKALINDFLGTPIITNPNSEGTIKSPNVSFDSDFYFFPAVGEIIKFFRSGDCNCELQDVCLKHGGPVGDKCSKAPWTHNIDMSRPCPYRLLWHSWGFDKCIPRITIIH